MTMPAAHGEVWDLRLHAAAAPQRLAIACGDERLSYGELEALANRVAAVFRALGLERGDHVASLIGNRPEALAIAWAAWRSGLYLTPMSTALTPSELNYLIQDCDARAVLVDAAQHDALTLPTLAGDGLHWLSLRGTMPGYTALEPLLALASPLPQADEPPGALMMYTSGTTGAPKGVIRPLLPADWRGTPPFAADLITLFDLAGPDVHYLSTAPLYHAAPLRFALAVTAGGGTVRVMARFDADEALRLLESTPITHSQWVPVMFQRLLALPPERRAAFKALAPPRRHPRRRALPAGLEAGHDRLVGAHRRRVLLGQ
jgi:long-chain acyl-CoA synthetase